MVGFCTLRVYKGTAFVTGCLITKIDNNNYIKLQNQPPCLLACTVIIITLYQLQ